MPRRLPKLIVVICTVVACRPGGVSREKAGVCRGSWDACVTRSYTVEPRRATTLSAASKFVSNVAANRNPAFGRLES